MMYVNPVIPLFIQLKDCSLLSNPKGLFGRIKETELWKGSWMDSEKFNTALKTDIHSFIHQYFWSTCVPGTVTQTFGMY